MRLRTADEPGRVASGALAVLVHLMFFGLLVFGISWQKKIASPVVVDLWQDLPEPAKKVALPPEPPKPAPKVMPPPPKPVPVPEVKKEPPPPPVPKVETPKVSAADIELKEKLRRQKEEEAQLREEQKKAEALRKEELKQLEAERKEEQKRAEAERKEEQKKVELEKRKLDEEQRKAAEEQRREEAEQKKAEQEKLRKEDEARRAEEHKRAEEQKRVEEAKREEERKQRAAAAERERQQQEAARKQREAEETKRRAEAAARAAQQKLIDDWKARIQAKIKGRVVLPPGTEGSSIEARFEVVLLPGGDVLRAALTKSSGNPAYDAAVERAIMAAQPLPVPNDTELFQENFRELNLVFRPKDKD
jgi:colicin import membrane protein